MGKNSSLAKQVIENGVVIDGLGNAPRRTNLVIEDTRILSVGDETPSEPAQRIDATNLVVMPGLIDAHCHISFDEPGSNDELFFHRRQGLAAIIAAVNARKLLCAGVTGFLDADSLFEIGVDLRDAIEAGIVPGPRMATGGNALLTAAGGTAGRLIPDEGVIGYGKVVRSHDEIRAEVRQQIKRGVDWIKVHVTGLTPRQKRLGEAQAWNRAELELVVNTAHDLDIPVVGHCRGAQSIRDAAEAGFDLILHATYMDEAALEAVVQARVPIVPTFTFQANLADYGERVGAGPEIRAIFQREIESSCHMLKRAYDAGVPLLCGTESGFSLTPYGDWHYRELEVFVRDLGLSPLEAIQAATSEAARAIGLYGQTGAIAPGYLADLLILDGDPAADIRVLGERQRIKRVMIGGREQALDWPAPDRNDPPGWRVSSYSDRILRRHLIDEP